MAMTTASTTHKKYYNFLRSEITSLLPNAPNSILEVGAASGATLKWLKSRFPNARTTGVELSADVAPVLAENVDVALIGSIDSVIGKLETYDLILLLDVLEHLDEPSDILKRLTKLLNDGGYMLISLPNVAHHSVLAPLLLKREFEYNDAGILDRTHRRFYTEKSAVRLANDAGLLVTKGLLSGFEGKKTRFINAVTFGAFKHYLTKQYIFRSRLNSRHEEQQAVHWVKATR